MPVRHSFSDGGSLSNHTNNKKGASVKRYIVVIAGLLSSLSIHTESEPEKKFAPLFSSFPIKVSGYIKHESFWDTRQVVGFGDDQALLFPEKRLLDPNCVDINAKGQYDMVAIQTRMRFEIEGPQVKNAKTHGVIEYDFFGKSDILNIVRMRHAHFFLTWENVEILAGQAYHPLYVIGADPRTLSFNTGFPMDTFSRNPQFRITCEVDPHVNLIFCASTQLDFTSDGPIGLSTTYLRNAVLPMLDFQIQTRWDDNLFGVGFDYKQIQPRLETNTGFKAYEFLSSFIAIAYSVLTWETFNTRTKFIFVQNGTDHTMIPGYAVHCIDPITDRRSYVNFRGLAVWNDSEITRYKSIIPGWFIGFTKNIGTGKTIFPDVVDSEGIVTERRIFGRGSDINYVFRVSPRIQWIVNNFMFGVELEYTRAGYGTIDLCDGKVVDLHPVANTRLLVTLYYYL